MQHERPTEDPRRRRTRRWAAIGGVSLAAVLVAGLLVALVGLRDDSEPLGFEPSPSPTASPLDESPTPTPPAAEPSPSEAPDVSPAPTPVAEATPTPVGNAWAFADLPPGILPPESLARVTLDGVRMRSEPGTDAAVVATLAAGEVVHLVSFSSGTREEDGYFWYIAEYLPGHDGWPVRPPQLYEEGSSYRTGFVALGTPEQPFFSLVEPRCPGDEPELAALVRITAWERLVCYGDRSLTLQGTFGCRECGGALGPSRWEPEWLASPLNFNPFSTSVASFEEDKLAMALHFDPGSGIERPPDGVIIRLAGHFDDPQARGCEMAWGERDDEVRVDPALAELTCRSRFVVDSYELIGTDPDFELR